MNFNSPLSYSTWDMDLGGNWTLYNQKTTWVCHPFWQQILAPSCGCRSREHCFPVLDSRHRYPAPRLALKHTHKTTLPNTLVHFMNDFWVLFLVKRYHRYSDKTGGKVLMVPRIDPKPVEVKLPTEPEGNQAEWL